MIYVVSSLNLTYIQLNNSKDVQCFKNKLNKISQLCWIWQDFILVKKISHKSSCIIGFSNISSNPSPNSHWNMLFIILKKIPYTIPSMFASHYFGNRNTAGNCNAPPESRLDGQQTTDSVCTHSQPDISV